MSFMRAARLDTNTINHTVVRVFNHPFIRYGQDMNEQQKKQPAIKEVELWLLQC
jgi:hypothetical protein